MMLPSRLLVPSLATLLLCGCAAVGPDYKPPAPATTAAGFAMSGDEAPALAALGGTAPAGAWWRALGSADLDRTIRQALKDSPTLTEADATLAQAGETAAAAGVQLGPQGQFNASASYNRVNLAAFGFTEFANPTVGLYSIGGTVSYDLDLAGGRRRALESAKARAEAAAYRAGAAYLTLTGDVAMQAVQIAALRAQIAADNAVIADDQTNLDLVRRALAAGSEPPAAQVNARAQLAEDETALPPVMQALAEARHALAVLVGRAPADFTAPDFDLAGLQAPASIPVELPSELAHNRPDILAAEADVHAATADIGVQQAKLYPDISLSAGLTQTSLTPDKILDYGFSGWNIGPGLSLPVLGRAGLTDQKKAAEAEARATFARYQATVLRAFGQVADALQALSSDEASIKAETEAEDQAQKNLDNTRFAYANGGGNLLNVTDAQRTLSHARIGLAQAQGRKLADVVRLYMATGADWADLGAERTLAVNGG